jgi:hypothetical protein
MGFIDEQNIYDRFRNSLCISVSRIFSQEIEPDFLEDQRVIHDLFKVTG